MSNTTSRMKPSHPPALDLLPLVNGRPQVAFWLEHYWRKLGVPEEQMRYLAVTEDRGEFAHWTGRRLNPMALGCYCYLPVTVDDAPVSAMASAASEAHLLAAPAGVGPAPQLVLPGFDGGPHLMPSAAVATPSRPEPTVTDFRHLIFIEPELEELGTEVTVAHELIHLADRVKGTPRKHRCHGHDAISVDEAAITGRDPDLLRHLLADETARREESLRRARPFRYVYECPHCKKEYRRVRKYARAVSCGRCDQHYNPAFLLQLRQIANEGAE